MDRKDNDYSICSFHQYFCYGCVYRKYWLLADRNGIVYTSYSDYGRDDYSLGIMALGMDRRISIYIITHLVFFD